MKDAVDSAFCIDALKEALACFGTPDVFNTDQDSQFTDSDFIDVLRDHHVKISMDGKGRYMDNIFIERLWRSVKHEEVYLHAYEDVGETRRGIGRYLDFYNLERPHQALGFQTPDAFYRGLVLARLKALRSDSGLQ